MPRKKQEPKPLFAVKHDFVETLDAFINATIMLRQVVGQALDLGCINNERIAALVKERLDALARAMDSRDEDEG